MLAKDFKMATLTSSVKIMLFYVPKKCLKKTKNDPTTPNNAQTKLSNPGSKNSTPLFGLKMKKRKKGMRKWPNKNQTKSGRNTSRMSKRPKLILKPKTTVNQIVVAQSFDDHTTIDIKN